VLAADILKLSIKADLSRDWTQIELASFYRVEAALIRSGLSVETDRGISDEGDPWFIFCRTGTEDIIAHFARYDGNYIIASPGTDKVARGRDFAALIKPLIDNYVPLVKLAEDERRVIILHPSALLFTLIVTWLFKVDRADARADIKELNNDICCGERSNTNLESHLRSDSIAVLIAAIGSTATYEHWQFSAPYLDESSCDRSDFETLDAADSHLILDADADDGSLVSNSVHLNAPGVKLDLNTEWQTFFNSFISESLELHSSFDLSSAIQRGIDYPVSSLDNQIKFSGIVYGSLNVIFASPQATLWNHSSMIQNTENVTFHSEAFQDASEVLGSLLPAHQVYDFSSAEPQLILHIIEDSKTLTGAVGNSAASGTQYSIKTIEPSRSEPSAVAAPAMSTSVSDAQVEKAINTFVMQHSDFQIIDVNNEVVIYDPNISSVNSSHVQIASYSLSDGSSVVLVGLGHTFS